MVLMDWTAEEVSVHESFSMWFRFDLTGESLQLFCPGEHLKEYNVSLSIHLDRGLVNVAAKVTRLD